MRHSLLFVPALLWLGCAAGSGAPDAPDAQGATVDGGDPLGAEDLCPPAGCLLPQGAACRWDTQCQEPLICHRGVCLPAAAAADLGPWSGDLGSAAAPDLARVPDAAAAPDLGPAAPDDGGAPLSPDAGPSGPPAPGCLPVEAACLARCAAQPCTAVCGDLDGDGLVTSCDAVCVQRAAQLSLSVCQAIHGDVDFDGSLTEFDLQRICNYVVSGIGSSLVCGDLPP